jgi:hypothetical protein
VREIRSTKEPNRVGCPAVAGLHQSQRARGTHAGRGPSRPAIAPDALEDFQWLQAPFDFQWLHASEFQHSHARLLALLRLSALLALLAARKNVRLLALLTAPRRMSSSCKGATVSDCREKASPQSPRPSALSPEA